MSRRGWLWVAFVVVHAAIAIFGFTMPNQPMGDVYFVYEPWSLAALRGDGIVGVTSSWVYPQLALIPMVLAHGLECIAGYEVAWAIMVTAFSALGFAVLVGRGRSQGRFTAAAFWLAYTALLGPIAMYRIDAVTVPLAVAGCLWLVGRPWLASALLAVATWIKVWPAALLLAALIAVRRRGAVIGGALAVSAATIVVVVLLGGGGHVFGFITDQADRGLQIEAPVSMAYLWLAVAKVPGSFLYYDRDLLTFQASGPEVDVVIALMTPLLALVVSAIAILGVVKLRRGASFAGLFPPLALSLVLALFVVNKVGSPQYLTWLIAPIVIGLVIDRRRWWRLATAALAVALLTQLNYPLLYGYLLISDAGAVAVLTARNLLAIALLVWSVIKLAKVPQRMRHPVPQPTPA
ncbi:glycosyltransferase 87 family protein [Microbacterium pumilum]|uniref:DUF2029 domain-containing protein n=1 Tax=Microbacterium pumilum TaxID=344165 RepID=A0ABP5DVX9_9MICO